MSKLPVEGKLNINVEPFAAALDAYLGNYFLEPPRGIYTIKDLDPVMVEGTQYYTLSDNGQCISKPVTDVSDLNTEIYTSDGMLVIPKHYMLNKDTCLSNYPFLPYRGVKIAIDAIKCEVFNSLKHNKVTQNFLDVVINHLKPELRQNNSIITEIENVYYTELRTLFDAIDSFIGGDVWHIYGVGSRGANAEVTKYIDFRIYDWTNRENEREKL